MPIYEDLAKRKNVLLLVDVLEDVDMIEGFEYDNLIKIGFLNEKVDDDLKYFKKAFDVVITNDGDFSYVNGLLQKILNLKP